MGRAPLAIHHHGRRKCQVFDFILRVIEQDGEPPSYGMIQLQLGMTNRANVHQVVKSLERDGCLRREGSGHQRRIRVA